MKRTTIILFGFVIAKIIFQFLLVGEDYELHRDEFLHLDQAYHLAWGYQSVPPVTSWISTLIVFLGKSIFWVRFFPALFGALTIVVVWKAIEELGGNLYALCLGAVCVLLSALLRLNLLYHPNSLDVLCWTLFYFTIIKHVKTGEPTWLYIGMAVFALGFLNKYNIVFLVVGLLPALFFYNRSIFKNKHFYLAVLLCAVIVLPNIIWQYNNNFPVVHHMKALADTQLVNVNRGDFLKDQLIFFMAALPVIGAGIYALLFYPKFKIYRSLFWSLIITLIVFVFLRAKSYYAIGLYPIYISFGAVYMEKKLTSRLRNYLRALLMLLPVLFFLMISNVAFPNKSPAYIASHGMNYQKLDLLRWEDGKDHLLPQDFADMLGWKELAGKVDAIYRDIQLKGHTIILCDNYGQAGAINYYTKIRGLRAVSFNADYIDWIKLDKKIVNVIRVKTAGSEGDEMQETGPLFTTGYQAGKISNPYAREYGTTVFVFTGAKVDVNSLIAKEIIEEKW